MFNKPPKIEKAPVSTTEGAVVENAPVNKAEDNVVEKSSVNSNEKGVEMENELKKTESIMKEIEAIPEATVEKNMKDPEKAKEIKKKILIIGGALIALGVMASGAMDVFQREDLGYSFGTAADRARESIGFLKMYVPMATAVISAIVVNEIERYKMGKREKAEKLEGIAA
jgi:hypothetical protein